MELSVGNIAQQRQFFTVFRRIATLFSAEEVGIWAFYSQFTSPDTTQLVSGGVNWLLGKVYKCFCCTGRVYKRYATV